MASRTAIGGMLLDTVEGWSFSLRDGVIAGRRGKQPGVLRIMSVAMNELKQPVTHDQCLQIASKWIDATSEKLTDVSAMQSATGPLGSATYHRRKDQIIVWYCTRPAGLIIGAYACPAALTATPEYRFLRAQCARMIASAIFDRLSWGGDDELTRIVISQLANDEAEELDRSPPVPPAGKSAEHSSRSHRNPKGPRR
jgi:hypothetical protein